MLSLICKRGTFKYNHKQINDVVLNHSETTKNHRNTKINQDLTILHKRMFSYIPKTNFESVKKSNGLFGMALVGLVSAVVIDDYLCERNNIFKYISAENYSQNYSEEEMYQYVIDTLDDKFSKINESVSKLSSKEVESFINSIKNCQLKFPTNMNFSYDQTQLKIKIVNGIVCGQVLYNKYTKIGHICESYELNFANNKLCDVKIKSKYYICDLKINSFCEYNYISDGYFVHYNQLHYEEIYDYSNGEYKFTITPVSKYDTLFSDKLNMIGYQTETKNINFGYFDCGDIFSYDDVCKYLKINEMNKEKKGKNYIWKTMEILREYDNNKTSHVHLKLELTDNQTTKLNEFGLPMELKFKVVKIVSNNGTYIDTDKCLIDNIILFKENDIITMRDNSFLTTSDQVKLYKFQYSPITLISRPLQ